MSQEREPCFLAAYGFALKHVCDHFVLDYIADVDEWDKFNLFHSLLWKMGEPYSMQQLTVPDNAATVQWFPSGRGILVLKPLPVKNGRECIPAMKIMTQFEEIPSVSKPQRRLCHGSIQIAILTTECLFADATDKEVRALGLRFELSESKGSGDTGVHDYAHVQFATELRTSANQTFPLTVMPQWLPDNQPAFTLDADGTDAAGLIANLLQSLYGKRAVAALKSTWHGPWSSINDKKKHPQHPRVFRK